MNPESTIAISAVEALILELAPKFIAAIGASVSDPEMVAAIVEPQIVAALGLLTKAVLDLVHGDDATKIRKDFDDDLVDALEAAKFPSVP